MYIAQIKINNDIIFPFFQAWVKVPSAFDKGNGAEPKIYTACDRRVSKAVAIKNSRIYLNHSEIDGGHLSHRISEPGDPTEF